jgi:hypothetical protein
MTNTRHALNRRMLLALPTAAVAAVLAVSPSFAATPTTAQAAPVYAAPSPTTATSQGIIMRDGGICDPIRHMGC